MEYRTTTDGLTVDSLHGFFVGWPNPPSRAKHLALLRGSAHVVLAFDDDRVIGFVNALSDGVLSAYIPLLEVLPEYQGRGIATELVRRLLAELDALYMVDLVCDDDLLPFYARFGMEPYRAAIRRNLAALDERGLAPAVE